MIITQIQLRNYPYKSRRGLSEKIVKDHFTKQGYKIFRGIRILGKENSINYYLYPNVKKKYDELENIMRSILGKNLENLRNLVKITNGIPDFFIFDPITKKSKFIEVKMENEYIKKNQLECMEFLQSFGFETWVLRVKKKIYLEKVEIDNGRRMVVAKQEKLWKKYSKR